MSKKTYKTIETPSGSGEIRKAGAHLAKVFYHLQVRQAVVAGMTGVPKRIQLRQLAHFYRADPEYGCGVAAGLGLPMKEVEGLAKLPLTDLIKATAL